MGTLFLLNNLPGTSEVWMERMIGEIQDDISVLVAKEPFGRDQAHYPFRCVSIKTPSRRINQLLSSRFGGLILQRELAKSNVNRVFCQYGTLAVEYLDILLKSNLPLFVHFHGFDATFDMKSHQAPFKPAHHEDYRENILALSRKALFIANSNHTKILLVNAGIPAERIIVKYYGVPLPRQQNRIAEAQELTILQVGRLVDFKSPDRTIVAFELARSKGLKANLIIAGDGPLRVVCELTRQRSEYKDSIHLLGSVSAEEVQRLMACADIYTQHNVKGELTSQEEAFGVSVIEAMANELPVVGTKSGGVLETVVNGETGILVSPGDIEAHANAFLYLSKDHKARQAMGKAGRQRVIENFSIERERKQLRQLLGIVEP